MSAHRTPTLPRVAVVPLGPEHADGVLAVYADGIATRQSTLETEVPSWSAWDAARLPAHRFVAVAPDGGLDGPADPVRGAPVGRAPAVLGWVAVSPVSPRAVYAGVVEHSIYVATAARGRGVGAALMSRLVESCDAGGIWTIQSGVFPDNTASLALHERFGFRRVGLRERIGRLDGRWRDLVLLERRSRVVGT